MPASLTALTARQQQVLTLIRAGLAENGQPPTRSEIAADLGLRSANAAQLHLQALAKKGYLELLPGRHRNIRLTAAGRGGCVDAALPIVGQVAAGTPILAEQHIDDYQPCPGLFSPNPDYLLRVRGMSMRDAGILDGDLLAVHRTASADDGQIVVARIDDEVTVKRLQRDNGRVRLLPANPDYAPIDVDPERHELVIEGVAVGVIRSAL